MNNYITIDFKNGETCHYKPDEYTEYKYDRKYFIVIRDGQWIGLYNLDEIRWVEISTAEEMGKEKVSEKTKTQRKGLLDGIYLQDRKS